MTATTPADQRVTARVPEHVRAVLVQAAGLSGATLNQFMVQAAFEKAQRVIEQERIIRLSAEDATCFFDALENPPKTNEKLKQAFDRYKASELYATD